MDDEVNDKIKVIEAELNKTKEEYKKLQDELNETKEHLKKYTAPKRSKTYYENHKEKLLEKMKKYIPPPEKIKEIASMGFKFSNGWFLNNGNPSRWEKFILKENPRKILEIGSNEGQATC